MQSRHEAAESVPRIVPQLLCTTETQQTQLQNKNNYGLLWLKRMPQNHWSGCNCCAVMVRCDQTPATFMYQLHQPAWGWDIPRMQRQYITCHQRSQMRDTTPARREAAVSWGQGLRHPAACPAALPPRWRWYLASRPNLGKPSFAILDVFYTLWHCENGI